MSQHFEDRITSTFRSKRQNAFATITMRKARIVRDGSTYRDKQEALDHLDLLERSEAPVHGIEIVRLSKFNAESNLNKTVWFADQDDVYTKSRKFLREQMIGVWNYAEFK